MDGKMSEDSTQQLSTEDHWRRHITHFRHWHGRCRVWKPLESADDVLSFRSSRSFLMTEADGSSVCHNNFFYGHEGSMPHKAQEQANWVMHKDTHSLPDGILHPSLTTRRSFYVNEVGEGVYLPLDLASGNDVLMPEFFFRRGPDDRLACWFVSAKDKPLTSCLIAEDASSSPDEPDATWVSPAWGEQGIPSRLPDSLPDLPTGLRGSYRSISSKLVTTHRAASPLEDYYPSGMKAEDKGCMKVIGLPLGVVLCVPGDVERVRNVTCAATWVKGEREVEKMSVVYGGEGRLEEVRMEHYTDDVTAVNGV